jgi:hypothetical protein
MGRPNTHLPSVWQKLWGTVGGDRWDDDSAMRLLELFRARAWERATPQREELATLFQSLVTIQFAAHPDWPTGLVRVHLRADDVAQELLMHLKRKAPRIWKAIGPKLRGARRNHYKLLLSNCYTLIVRKTLELIAGQRRRKRTAAYATDVLDDDDRRGGSPTGAFGGMAAPAEDRFEETAALAGLLEHLHAVEDEVIGDIVVCGKRAADVVLTLHARLCQSIARGGGIIPHEELPARLRDSIIPGLHALVAARLMRQAERFAAAAA